MGSSCFPATKNLNLALSPSFQSNYEESRTVRFGTEMNNPYEKMHRDKWKDMRSYQKLNSQILSNFEKILTKNDIIMSRSSKYNTTGKSNLNHSLIDNSSVIRNNTKLNEENQNTKLESSNTSKFKSNQAQNKNEKNINQSQVSRKNGRKEKRLTIMTEMDERYEESLKNSSKKTGKNQSYKNMNSSSKSKSIKDVKGQKSIIKEKDYQTLRKEKRKFSGSPEKVEALEGKKRENIRSKTLNQKEKNQNIGFDIKMQFKTQTGGLLLN